MVARDDGFLVTPLDYWDSITQERNPGPDDEITAEPVIEILQSMGRSGTAVISTGPIRDMNMEMLQILQAEEDLEG